MYMFLVVLSFYAMIHCGEALICYQCFETNATTESRTELTFARHSLKSCGAPNQKWRTEECRMSLDACIKANGIDEFGYGNVRLCGPPTMCSDLHSLVYREYGRMMGKCDHCYKDYCNGGNRMLSLRNGILSSLVLCASVLMVFILQ